MSKVRVYEVAKQLNLDPKAVVALFQAVGVSDVRNHMSSVDPEQVERVKRHLEKQRTHDVVEERVRTDGRVIKRRAIAKPVAGGDVSAQPSAPSLPAVPRSVRDVAAALPSAPDSMSAAAISQTDVSRIDRESGRLPPVAEDRRSTRELPVDRKSARDVAVAVNEPEEAPVPASVRAKTPPPTDIQVAPAVPAPEISSPPPPSTATPAPPSAPASVAAIAAPPPSEVAPASRREEVAREPTPPPPVAPVPSEPPRQKTGVEYWTGRPGVPMPTPASAQRTAIGGGAAGAMARRVQYDPRAQQGGPRRPGAPTGPGGRPMMGMRGGPGMRGRFPGAQPFRKSGGGAVSTQEMSQHKKVIRIEENITLASMAAKMSLKATELLGKLLSMGMTGVHINTTLDADTAKILASEFGWEVEDVAVSEEANIAAARGPEGEGIDTDLEPRPPVVTVMGHVDHGKTSLLDRIRKTDVASGEAGGITQHIGAYKVNTPRGTIVFLDTPGHEAFTAMRARGASVTDIVILVVAADDGVMPQTREAINHAKAAEVPIIVAVNKIDKPSAEPERVRRELVEAGLQPEEWGGDTIFVNVSAQAGTGVEQLLEMIGLQAEVLDLKANPKRPASGTVIEALLDRGRGPVARVLVQDGTLRVGDFVLAGAGFGKVRAMTNEHGKQVHEAGPATPVEILGLSEVPGAGDPMHAVKDPKKAQEIADSRKGKMAKSLIPSTAKVSLEELSKRIAESGLLELRVIIKGDVQGSVEAVADALSKLSGEKVKLSIIHAGVGAITEGDVNLATASKAIIIGFNVRPAGKSQALAEENKIEIRLYSIIYDAVNDVRGAMEGLLPPNLVEKANGKAEARQIFKVKGVVVAGCYVTEGTFKRAGKARLVRDGAVVWEGKVDALKRFKDDAREVAEGMECGISLENYNDVKEKDIIESYDVEEIRQKL
jgi:translation initiation factor IF-2